MNKDDRSERLKVREIYSKLPKLPEPFQEKRIETAEKLWEELEKQGWSLQLNPVIFTTPQLAFTDGEDWSSSRYEIRFKEDWYPYLTALDSNNWPSPHPHVDNDGSPCMGEIQLIYNEPFMMVQQVANTLNGPITRRSEYYNITHYLRRKDEGDDS